MLRRLRERKEWKFFAALPQADRRLALAWWAVFAARPRCRRVFAIAMGASSPRCSAGSCSAPARRSVGVVFVLLQVLTPIQQAVSDNLGDRTAAWLYDRLTEACVRPPGMGHLEDPTLTGRPHRRARLRPRHDRPAAVILDGLHRRRAGRDDRRARRGRGPVRVRVVGAARARRRVAGDALAAARERRLARPQHRRGARAPSATPTTRIASRSIRRPARSCACSASSAGRIERFIARRTRLHELQYEATRLRERPLAWSLLLVTGRERPRVLVARRRRPPSGRLDLGELVVFAQCAVGTSLIAFGGLNWALDGAAAPVAAVLRLEPAMASGRRAALRATRPGRRTAGARDPLPRRDVRVSRRRARCSTAST